MAVTIETADLLLKKARMEDWRAIYQNLWCHAESARYMFWEVTVCEADAIARMQRTLDFQKTHEYALFIYEKKSGQAIGFAGMQELAPGVFEETGIALGPRFTGKGYGTQALNALVQTARELGAHRFNACCRRENLASHALQMRCGFHFVGEEPRIDPRTGETYKMEFNVKELTEPEERL